MAENKQRFEEFIRQLRLPYQTKNKFFLEGLGMANTLDDFKMLNYPGISGTETALLIDTIWKFLKGPAS